MSDFFSRLAERTQQHAVSVQPLIAPRFAALPGDLPFVAPVPRPPHESADGPAGHDSADTMPASGGPVDQRLTASESGGGAAAVLLPLAETQHASQLAPPQAQQRRSRSDANSSPSAGDSADQSHLTSAVPIEPVASVPAGQSQQGGSLQQAGNLVARGRPQLSQRLAVPIPIAPARAVTSGEAVTSVKAVASENSPAAVSRLEAVTGGDPVQAISVMSICTGESGVEARAQEPARRPQFDLHAGSAAANGAAVASQPAVVQVTIGRIEVRAAITATNAAKPTPRSPGLTLDDYLKQHHGRRR